MIIDREKQNRKKSISLRGFAGFPETRIFPWLQKKKKKKKKKKFPEIRNFASRARAAENGRFRNPQKEPKIGHFWSLSIE